MSSRKNFDDWVLRQLWHLFTGVLAPRPPWCLQPWFAKLYSCPSLETMPFAIVTGANTGLGYETALALSQRGFEVLITSRDLQKGQAAISRIKRIAPSAQVSVLELDLSSMESIENFGAAYRSRFGGWDVLVNNAGAKILSNYSETIFGVEYHFGVNAVGHFALSMDLLKQRNANSRLVSVASIIARFAPQPLGPSGSKKSYQPGASYSASKLANLAFALELENRLGSESFSSLAAHPGFARAEPYGPASTRFFESFLAQSAKSGARPIVEAATNKQVPGGAYLGPKFLELWGNSAPAKIPARLTKDQLQENWKILESLSGKKLVV
jgi:NAD(P)-dependent dehydrogenase (short-subunit alcohol dehydrogenase family)